MKVKVDAITPEAGLERIIEVTRDLCAGIYECIREAESEADMLHSLSVLTREVIRGTPEDKRNLTHVAFSAIGMAMGTMANAMREHRKARQGADEWPAGLQSDVLGAFAERAHSGLDEISRAENKQRILREAAELRRQREASAQQ